MKQSRKCKPQSGAHRNTALGTVLVVLIASSVYAVETPPLAPMPMHSIYIDAKSLAGSKDAIRETDKLDSFQYIQSKDAEGVSFTVTPQEAGEWYVFVRLRIGATEPLDQEAGLITLAQGADATAGKLAVLRVSGSPGDDSWQTLCLGKLKLESGMRITAKLGTKNPVRFLDVRNVLLASPAVFESSLKQQ